MSPRSRVGGGRCRHPLDRGHDGGRSGALAGRPELLAADRDGDVDLVALGVGERPPLRRSGVVDDAPAGGEGGRDARLRLVVRDEDVDVGAVALGAAGRATLGWGQRLLGADRQEVTASVQRRTAEQLFEVLGTLKGGAMKLGQALSVFEAALPEEVAGPYREQLTKLQDSAPPMPTSTVREILARDLGPDWQDRLVWLEEGEFLIVPRGVEHRPVADEEVHVLLFEPATTLNTGDVRDGRTVERPERI